MESASDNPFQAWAPVLNAIYVLNNTMGDNNNRNGSSIVQHRNAAPHVVDKITVENKTAFFVPDFQFFYGPATEMQQLANAVGYSSRLADLYIVPCEMKKKREPQIVFEIVANGEEADQSANGKSESNYVNLTLTFQQYVFEFTRGECALAFSYDSDHEQPTTQWWLANPIVRGKCFQLGFPPNASTWIALASSLQQCVEIFKEGKRSGKIEI